MPGDKPELRDPRYQPKENRHWNFPRVQHRYIYALAQHYGIPTRLLDWSRSPLIAAYFAACDVVAEEGNEASGQLSVWALSTEAFDRFGGTNPGIMWIGAPSDSNPNLHAQRGSFTQLVRRKCEQSAWPDTWDNRSPDLDFLVAELGKELTAPLLVKCTLDKCHATDLLDLLDHFHVNAMSVYPGRESIVTYMKR